MARRASRLAGGAAAARTGGGDVAARPRDGIITGFLLKQIRQSTGLSQEGLAERLSQHGAAGSVPRVTGTWVIHD